MNYRELKYFLDDEISDLRSTEYDVDRALSKITFEINKNKKQCKKLVRLAAMNAINSDSNNLSLEGVLRDSGVSGAHSFFEQLKTERENARHLIVSSEPINETKSKIQQIQEQFAPKAQRLKSLEVVINRGYALIDICLIIAKVDTKETINQAKQAGFIKRRLGPRTNQLLKVLKEVDEQIAVFKARVSEEHYSLLIESTCPIDISERYKALINELNNLQESTAFLQLDKLELERHEREWLKAQEVLVQTPDDLAKIIIDELYDRPKGFRADCWIKFLSLLGRDKDSEQFETLTAKNKVAEKIVDSLQKDQATLSDQINNLERSLSKVLRAASRAGGESVRGFDADLVHSQLDLLRRHTCRRSAWGSKSSRKVFESRGRHDFDDSAMFEAYIIMMLISDQPDDMAFAREVFSDEFNAVSKLKDIALPDCITDELVAMNPGLDMGDITSCTNSFSFLDIVTPDISIPDASISDIQVPDLSIPDTSNFSDTSGCFD